MGSTIGHGSAHHRVVGSSVSVEGWGLERRGGGGTWEAGFAAPVEVILFLFVQQRGGGCSLGLGGGGGKV